MPWTPPTLNPDPQMLVNDSMWFSMTEHMGKIQGLRCLQKLIYPNTKGYYGSLIWVNNVCHR